MALKVEFRRTTILAAVLAPLAAIALAVTSASPARADRCDDHCGPARKTQIDGLKVGITAAKVIYLSHPLAKELSLGCASRKFSNELFAKADSRQTEAGIRRSRRQRRRFHLYAAERRDAERRFAVRMPRMGIFRGRRCSRSATAAST